MRFFVSVAGTEFELEEEQEFNDLKQKFINSNIVIEFTDKSGIFISTRKEKIDYFAKKV